MDDEQFDWMWGILTRKFCPECNEDFDWLDKVVVVDGICYHEYCVDLFPIGYIAMTKGRDYLGETDNDEGDEAYNYMDFTDEECK